MNQGVDRSVIQVYSISPKRNRNGFSDGILPIPWGQSVTGELSLLVWRIQRDGQSDIRVLHLCAAAFFDLI